jgi:hypothetical protein
MNRWILFPVLPALVAFVTASFNWPECEGNDCGRGHSGPKIRRVLFTAVFAAHETLPTGTFRHLNRHLPPFRLTPVLELAAESLERSRCPFC